MNHVVMFSGGIGSWAAAKRVAERYGVDDLTLLFTDTLIEDEDLYRFLTEAAANIGVPLTRIAEGRSPWQVFFDVRFLGNSRVDPCSKILKREMADKWLDQHCDPMNTIVYVGIDWSEEHRLTRLAARRMERGGWRYLAPLCDAPYLTKTQLCAWAEREGLRVPRLYAMGFAHNNCGGFCIKGGQGHYATLLREMPERYREHEEMEEAFRDFIGRDVSILKDRRGGVVRTLTLHDLRRRIEAKEEEVDRFDIGGCGCFSTVEEEECNLVQP